LEIVWNIQFADLSFGEQIAVGTFFYYLILFLFLFLFYVYFYFALFCRV